MSAGVKQEADNLANDVMDIVGKHLGPSVDFQKQSDLIQDLCIYIVQRDMKVLQEGMSRRGQA